MQHRYKFNLLYRMHPGDRFIKTTVCMKLYIILRRNLCVQIFQFNCHSLSPPFFTIARPSSAHALLSVMLFSTVYHFCVLHTIIFKKYVSPTHSKRHLSVLYCIWNTNNAVKHSPEIVFHNFYLSDYFSKKTPEVLLLGPFSVCRSFSGFHIVNSLQI